MENKREKKSLYVKQMAVSVCCYGVIFALLFYPWVVIGDASYHPFQLAMKMTDPGLEALLAGADIYVNAEDFSILQVGVWMELIFCGLFFLSGIFYLLSVLVRKKRPFNIAACVFALVTFYFNAFGYTIRDISTDQALGTTFLFVYLFLSAAELVLTSIMGIWKETKRVSKEYHERERKEREEKRERLAFSGRYNELFYGFIWKNFKSSWKDYILLFLCSSMVFAFIVIGFGMQAILSRGSRYEGMSQVFGGLSTILKNAVLPMGMISVIIIVILVFNYLRCRAKNYGIFLTLGMRKRTLKYFVAVEFAALLVLTLAVGGAAGTGCLALFCLKSEGLIGSHVGLSAIGALTYVKSMGVLFLIFLISFMAARDIFMDFNMGRSTDLKAVREKLPGWWRKVLLVIGILACAYSVYGYRQLKNFESVRLLMVLFAGLYLVFRYGIALWLMGERGRSSYLKNLLLHNQLYHKSRTNTGYIFAMAVIQFCALFYFSFQIISTEIAEDADTLFPYDIVCVGDEEDEGTFQELKGKYGMELEIYPMVRIASYDSTEKTEGWHEGEPPQGQHLGVSESTYHALKGKIDASYKAKPLHLDKEGERVYIVHQQDKSVKAQPIDFFLSRKKPLLHVGQPGMLSILDAYRANVCDFGYYHKTVQGEEIGSVTGAFRQGLRDNLVVFSDAYFEKAQELWRTTNMYTGAPIPEDEEKIVDENIRQGLTRLVLIKADSEDVPDILSDLAEFRERHREDEHYDLTVPCLYDKAQAVSNLAVERVMKKAMNGLVMLVSLTVYLVLLNVKMATESDMAARRMEFLQCMGMRAGERRRLLRKELLRYYYLLPTAVAVGSAGAFTAAVFLARQYTRADRLRYIKFMAPMWAVCLGAIGMIVVGMVEVYVRKAEGKGEKNGKRN